jgi:hypothetical protein
MRALLTGLMARWLARRTPYELAQAWPRLAARLPRLLRRPLRRALMAAARKDPRAAMRLVGQHLAGC